MSFANCDFTLKLSKLFSVQKSTQMLLTVISPFFIQNWIYALIKHFLCRISIFESTLIEIAAEVDFQHTFVYFLLEFGHGTKGKSFFAQAFRTLALLLLSNFNNWRLLRVKFDLLLAISFLSLNSALGYVPILVRCKNLVRVFTLSEVYCSLRLINNWYAAAILDIIWLCFNLWKLNIACQGSWTFVGQVYFVCLSRT